jgi:peptide subunit release factor RF-3
MPAGRSSWPAKSRRTAGALGLDGGGARARHLGLAAVMSFEHEGLAFNLLDIPGHQDFSEGTYRTLTTVGNAVMVLDAAKITKRGLDEPTRTPFEVCQLHDVPILTFVDELDAGVVTRSISLLRC